MGLMMNIEQLLFELSHDTRTNILRALAKQPNKLVRIAELLDGQPSGVARHLNRLRDAGLVVKGMDGTYSLSPMGGVMDSMIPGFGFVANNWDYFREHDLSTVPTPFRARLGELRNSERFHGTLEAIERGVDVVLRSEEHLFMIVN